MAWPMDRTPGIASEHTEDELALLLLLLHRGYADIPSDDQDEVVHAMSRQLVMRDPADVIKTGSLQREVVDRAWKLKQEVPIDRLALPLKTCTTSAEPWNLSPSEMRTLRLPLPFKLYSILMNPRYRDIVSWLPGGRVWKIHDLDAFENEILPLYFDYGSYNFNIFVRLSKVWNFSPCIDEGARSYFHESFVEGKPELLRVIRPGNLQKANSDQDSTSRCVRLEDFLKAQQTGSRNPRGRKGGQSFTMPVIIQSWEINLQVLRRLVSPSRKSTVPQDQLWGFNHHFRKGLSPKPSLKTSKLFDPVGSLNELKFQVSMIAKEMHDKVIQRLKTAKNTSVGTRTSSPQSVASSSPATEDSSKGTKRSIVEPVSSLATVELPSSPVPAKKQRRKWLPPLGPATPTTSKNRGKSRMEWIYTSPEAFATIHGPSD